MYIWPSRDLRSADCAGPTTRTPHNSLLRNVTGVWDLRKNTKKAVVWCCKGLEFSSKFNVNTCVFLGEYLNCVSKLDYRTLQHSKFMSFPHLTIAVVHRSISSKTRLTLTLKWSDIVCTSCLVITEIEQTFILVWRKQRNKVNFSPLATALLATWTSSFEVAILVKMAKTKE